MTETPDTTAGRRGGSTQDFLAKGPALVLHCRAPSSSALAGCSSSIKRFTPQLPGCAADETGTVIRNIFKSKNADLTVLNDMKTMTNTSSAQTCQAHVETASETATIFYTITLDGKNFQVKIDKVDAKPR